MANAQTITIAQHDNPDMGRCYIVIYCDNPAMLELVRLALPEDSFYESCSNERRLTYNDLTAKQAEALIIASQKSAQDLSKAFAGAQLNVPMPALC